MFEDDDLLYYGIKEIGRHRQSNTPASIGREAVRIVQDLLHKYSPNIIALQKLNRVQCLSPQLVYLTRQITIAIRKQKLPVREYDRMSARRLLCPYQRATKYATATRLALIYPELGRFVKDVTLWQRLYYAPIFDALAIGYSSVADVRSRHNPLHT